MDLSRLIDSGEGTELPEDHAGAAALLSLSPIASTSAQPQPQAPVAEEEPDCLAGQLVKTHFGGSGKHYEPIKPWRETVAALRRGEEPASALHRTIAYNTSYLRTYFAKVEACPEQHGPVSDCMGACLGQPHKHGYVCRFCGCHVSSDLHQFKWGPAIRHFKQNRCTLPADELELFVEAVHSLDTQYIESYIRAEERHAERYAATRGNKGSTGKKTGKKVQQDQSRSGSEETENDTPKASTRRTIRDKAVAVPAAGEATQSRPNTSGPSPPIHTNMKARIGTQRQDSGSEEYPSFDKRVGEVDFGQHAQSVVDNLTWTSPAPRATTDMRRPASSSSSSSTSSLRVPSSTYRDTRFQPYPVSAQHLSTQYPIQYQDSSLLPSMGNQSLPPVRTITWPQSAPHAYTGWPSGLGTHSSLSTGLSMGPQYDSPSMTSHYRDTHSQLLYPHQIRHMSHPDPHFQHDLMYQRRSSVPELRTDPTRTLRRETVSPDQTQERQDRFGSGDH